MFNNEENMLKVKEILGCEIIFLVLDDGTVGTFYKGEETVRFLRKRREERIKFRIEVSDEEEAQTEANLTVPVTVNHCIECVHSLGYSG